MTRFLIFNFAQILTVIQFQNSILDCDKVESNSSIFIHLFWNAYFMNVNETCQFTVYPEEGVNTFKINTYLMFSVIKLDFSSWIHPSKCTHDLSTFMENCNFESLKVNTTLMLWPIFNVTEVTRCVNRRFFSNLKTAKLRNDKMFSRWKKVQLPWTWNMNEKMKTN